MDKKFITEKEAADYLSVKSQTLRAWRSTGGGPDFIKAPSGLVRYRIADLDLWMLSREVTKDGADSNGQTRIL